MDKFIESNRELWDQLTEVNAKSKFYDVAGFKAGNLSLLPLEIKEVGDVKGKKLLHLQCHFGMDTLSWARLGADVTGVDFSPKAIKLARELSSEVNIASKFIEGSINDLPDILQDRFDIVFTSYGVLPWLPNLREWANVIVHFLKPGGFFYIVEMHPINSVFENEKYTEELKVRYSYFHNAEPSKWEDDEPYVDYDDEISLLSYEWTHSVSDVMNSLIKAGLVIERFNEFPFCMYARYPFLEKCSDGWYQFKGRKETIPMLFSLKARKPICGTIDTNE